MGRKLHFTQRNIFLTEKWLSNWTIDSLSCHIRVDSTTLITKENIYLFFVRLEFKKPIFYRLKRVNLDVWYFLTLWPVLNR